MEKWGAQHKADSDIDQRERQGGCQPPAVLPKEAAAVGINV